MEKQRKDFLLLEYTTYLQTRRGSYRYWNTCWEEARKSWLCCGSSKELKALREIALKIIPDSQIGIYYANSPKQHELRDVKKFWPNYNLIGFTSTITVSIDFY